MAAFAVIPVLLMGVGVHIHQSESVTSCDAQEVYVCAYGCEHPRPDAEQNQPARPHDHSDCQVCQLLAQPLSLVVVLELPQAPEALPAVVEQESNSAEASVCWSVRPRGPPVAALPAAV